MGIIVEAPEEDVLVVVVVRRAMGGMRVLSVGVEGEVRREAWRKKWGASMMVILRLLVGLCG